MVLKCTEIRMTIPQVVITVVQHIVFSVILSITDNLEMQHMVALEMMYIQ